MVDEDVSQRLLELASGLWLNVIRCEYQRERSFYEGETEVMGENGLGDSVWEPELAGRFSLHPRVCDPKEESSVFLSEAAYLRGYHFEILGPA